MYRRLLRGSRSLLARGNHRSPAPSPRSRGIENSSASLRPRNQRIALTGRLAERPERPAMPRAESKRKKRSVVRRKPLSRVEPVYTSRATARSPHLAPPTWTASQSMGESMQSASRAPESRKFGQMQPFRPAVRRRTLPRSAQPGRNRQHDPRIGNPRRRMARQVGSVRGRVSAIVGRRPCWTTSRLV
jgi:hypothetical protein